MCLAFLGETAFARLDLLSLVFLLYVITFIFWISTVTVSFWVTSENIFATTGCVCRGRHILQTYPKQMPLAVMFQCNSPDVMLITLLVNLGLMHSTTHMTHYITYSPFQTMQSVSWRDHTATIASTFAFIPILLALLISSLWQKCPFKIAYRETCTFVLYGARTAAYYSVKTEGATQSCWDMSVQGLQSSGMWCCSVWYRGANICRSLLPLSSTVSMEAGHF